MVADESTEKGETGKKYVNEAFGNKRVTDAGEGYRKEIIAQIS